MQESIELAGFKSWTRYTRYDEHFDSNIEGVYCELIE